MNALIISAVFGVIMMFSGILLKQKSAIRNIAIAGMGLLLVLNVLELYGVVLFTINTHEMILFDRFALVFNVIAVLSTLIYLVLSGRDMEKVGLNYSDYLALIFFIICGIAL